MENNKIFAAVLVAGIAAMLSGFIADRAVISEYPEQDAVTIEVAMIGSANAAGADKADGPDRSDIGVDCERGCGQGAEAF